MLNLHHSSKYNFYTESLDSLSSSSSSSSSSEYSPLYNKYLYTGLN